MRSTPTRRARRRRSIGVDGAIRGKLRQEAVERNEIGVDGGPRGVGGGRDGGTELVGMPRPIYTRFGITRPKNDSLNTR